MAAIRKPAAIIRYNCISTISLKGFPNYDAWSTSFLETLGAMQKKYDQELLVSVYPIEGNSICLFREGIPDNLVKEVITEFQASAIYRKH